jgi:catechol 2,3-dioxygenase-like lactoylglutathione lyase family enzyme
LNLDIAAGSGTRPLAIRNCGMIEENDNPPLQDWAPLAPALIVSDLAKSLSFWTDVLGFTVAYERAEDAFVYLAQGNAHVMLYQRCDSYETATLEAPYGRGVMLQIEAQDVGAVQRALSARNWPLYEPLTEVWFRAGRHERGLRKFLVQDPDGYLLMVYDEIGVRAIV